MVGQKCTYEGQLPNDSKINKIKNWPLCKSTMEVRGFLGTTGTIQNWVDNYATIAQPLNMFMRKNSKFVWGDSQQQAMDSRKAAVVSFPAIRPINYLSTNEVILAVNSSFIACGWILSQLNNDSLG